MSRFITVNEAIDIATLGNNDLLQMSKGRYRQWAKYVWACLKFWAVLSFSSKKSEIDENADGLIKIIQLKNEKAETGFLTLWQKSALK